MKKSVNHLVALHIIFSVALFVLPITANAQGANKQREAKLIEGARFQKRRFLGSAQWVPQYSLPESFVSFRRTKGLALMFLYLHVPVPVYGTIWILRIAFVTKYMRERRLMVANF